MSESSEAGRSVLIAANPKSGAGSSSGLVADLRAELIRRGYQADVISSLERLRAEVDRLQSCRRLVAVVSAGGDGTVSCLANILPDSVPLLIFPLGTENLLARHWGLTKHVDAACDIVRGGRVVQMDVGTANGKLFLVMLSCGFDAAVVQRMHSARAGHIRRWMYAGPILKSLTKYNYPEMSWTVGRSHVAAAADHLVGSAALSPHRAAWLFVFNVPRYAAHLQFCPQADPLDGKLDVCTFRKSGAWMGMYYLMQLWRGRHTELADFEHSQVRSMTIHPPLDLQGQPAEVPFQIDGDPGGVLPLTIETQPGRLRLLVPESCETTDPVLSTQFAVASA